MLELVTVAVLVPPAVPVIATSPVAKVVTDSLKTTVKLIGLVPVGSAWPPAWLIVTVGAVASTVKPVTEVDSTLPAKSVAFTRRV